MLFMGSVGIHARAHLPRPFTQLNNINLPIREIQLAEKQGFAFH